MTPMPVHFLNVMHVPLPHALLHAWPFPYAPFPPSFSPNKLPQTLYALPPHPTPFPNPHISSPPPLPRLPPSLHPRTYKCWYNIL